MKNCTGINCPMQYGVVDSATCPAVECCPNATPPLTNGDCIRAMTDEELATLIVDNIDCIICKEMHDPKYKRCPGNINEEKGCCAIWLDWLKQEATG